MNDQRYKDLAREARVLYILAQNMQRIMLDMFLEEFITLDEEEQRLLGQQHDLPF